MVSDNGKILSSSVLSQQVSMFNEVMGFLDEFMYKLHKTVTHVIGSDNLELLDKFKFPEEQQSREVSQFKSNWGTKKDLVKTIHTKLEAFTKEMDTYLSQIRDIWPNIVSMADEYILKEFALTSPNSAAIRPQACKLKDIRASVKLTSNVSCQGKPSIDKSSKPSQTSAIDKSSDFAPPRSIYLPPPSPVLDNSSSIESLQPKPKKVKRPDYVSARNSLISLKTILDRRFSQITS